MDSGTLRQVRSMGIRSGSFDTLPTGSAKVAEQFQQIGRLDQRFRSVVQPLSAVHDEQTMDHFFHQVVGASHAAQKRDAKHIALAVGATDLARAVGVWGSGAGAPLFAVITHCAHSPRGQQMGYRCGQMQHKEKPRNRKPNRDPALGDSLPRVKRCQ